MKRTSALALGAAILLLGVSAVALAAGPGDASTRIRCKTEDGRASLAFDEAAGPVLVSADRLLDLSVRDLVNSVALRRQKVVPIWESLEGAPPLVRWIYQPTTVGVGEPFVPFILIFTPEKMRSRDVFKGIFRDYRVCVDGVCFDATRLARFRGVRIDASQCSAFFGVDSCWAYGFNYVLELRDPGVHVIEQQLWDTFPGEESILRLEWKVTAE